MKIEEIIKAYNEMEAAQAHFLETKDDGDLIKAREAEHKFHELAESVARLPFPQNEAEQEREQKRREEICGKAWKDIASAWSKKPSKPCGKSCHGRRGKALSAALQESV